MASFDDSMAPPKGTIFYVGSWAFAIDGLGAFDSHLIDPNMPEAPETTQQQEVNNFVDQLDEIPLPIHVNEVQNQSNFNVTTPKTFSKLEEDLDSLSEVSRQEAIVDQEAPMLNFSQDTDRYFIASTRTIEKYLKDLMAIPHPPVDNSKLLNGIDHVPWQH